MQKHSQQPIMNTYGQTICQKLNIMYHNTNPRIYCQIELEKFVPNKSVMHLHKSSILFQTLKTFIYAVSIDKTMKKTCNIESYDWLAGELDDRVIELMISDGQQTEEEDMRSYMNVQGFAMDLNSKSIQVASDQVFLKITGVSLSGVKNPVIYIIYHHNIHLHLKQLTRIWINVLNFMNKRIAVQLAKIPRPVLTVSSDKQ